MKGKQVHSDNVASKVDILGQFGRHFDEFGPFGLFPPPSHFRPFSSIIGSFKKKRDEPMDGRTDPLIEMRGRI